MRRYETVFVLRSDLGEPQVKEITNRLGTIVGAGSGEILEAEEWGVRELAYRIKGERRGFYVRLDYAAGGGTMNEVERNLKLSDSVLRYLSVLVDPDADVEKAKAEIEARRHRAAEAKAQAEARAAAAAAAAAAPERSPDDAAAGGDQAKHGADEPHEGEQN